MSLQEALRQMRLELGITQMDLAQKLNKSFLTVNRWENGKGFPSRENARRILKIAYNGDVSEECYSYLSETLMPDIKRSKSAAEYGFPDIDREFLFQLADSSMNALYVIEVGTYELLYANRKAEQSAVEYLRDRGQDVSERRLLAQRDRRCFRYFGGLSAPCDFCPLKDAGDQSSFDAVVAPPQTGRILHVHAKRTKMKRRDVYIIYLTDVTKEDLGTHALYELTNDIPGGVGIYNVYHSGRLELVFMNTTFFKMIGAERRDALLVTGDSDMCLVLADDRERLWREIDSARAENRPIDINLRMRVVDGAYHWLHLVGKPIKRDAEKDTFYCLFSEVQPLEETAGA